MPQLTITIDEQQEAKIVQCIDERMDFRVDAGTVKDSDGKDVFLTGITFCFEKNFQQPLATSEPPG